MSKLARSSAFAQLLNGNMKKDKNVDKNKDESENKKMKNKSPTQKKISIGIPLNELKNKHKEQKMNENHHSLFTPTKSNLEGRKSSKQSSYIKDVERSENREKVNYTPEPHQNHESNKNLSNNSSNVHNNSPFPKSPNPRISKLLSQYHKSPGLSSKSPNPIITPSKSPKTDIFSPKSPNPQSLYPKLTIPPSQYSKSPKPQPQPLYPKSPKPLVSPKPIHSPEIVDIESEEESLSPSPIQTKGLPILSLKNTLLTEYDLNGWLNDADIDFFALYSLNIISESKNIEKYYIFPSFLSLYLFKSIEKIDKSWFKGLKLKKVKFLIFPINFNMHWSLAVIVNANKYYKKYKNPQYEYSENTEPFIMLMDSMGLHSITMIQERIKKLYCYLYSQEEKEEEEDDDKKKEYKPIDIKYSRLDLPKQENARDCGVFILFYLFYLLQSDDVIEYDNLTEWSKKCNFPVNSIFLRSYLMFLIHEIYIEKNKENKDENYNRNKKIINNLYRRENLYQPLLIKLHKTCPLLQMNGLIKQNIISGKSGEINSKEDKKDKKEKKKEKDKEKEKEEDDDGYVSPGVMDILEGKTINQPEETNKKGVKRKLDNNTSENREGSMKKMYNMFRNTLNTFNTLINPKHDVKKNENVKPIIPSNPANNIKKIIPKQAKELNDLEDLSLPPVESLHDIQNNDKVMKKKKNKILTKSNKGMNNKEDIHQKKRKKEKEGDEENAKKKKHKTSQSIINFSKKTKSELDNVETPTKKK